MRITDLLIMVGSVTDRAVIRDVHPWHIQVRVMPQCFDALRALFHMYLPLGVQVDLAPLGHEAQYTHRIIYLMTA